MKTRSLAIEKKAHIVGMHKGSVKGVEIVATLDHPKSTVSIVLKEFERGWNVEHPKSTKCP